MALLGVVFGLLKWSVTEDRKAATEARANIIKSLEAVQKTQADESRLLASVSNDVKHATSEIERLRNVKHDEFGKAQVSMNNAAIALIDATAALREATRKATDPSFR